MARVITTPCLARQIMTERMRASSASAGPSLARKVRNATVLRPNGADPVELLALADVTRQKMNSGNIEER